MTRYERVIEDLEGGPYRHAIVTCKDTPEEAVACLASLDRWEKELRRLKAEKAYAARS